MSNDSDTRLSYQTVLTSDERNYLDDLSKDRIEAFMAITLDGITRPKEIEFLVPKFAGRLWAVRDYYTYLRSIGALS